MRYYFILLFTYLAINCLSQRIIIKWGEEVKEERPMAYYLGGDSASYYTSDIYHSQWDATSTTNDFEHANIYKHSYSNIILNKHSTSGKLIYSKQIEFPKIEGSRDGHYFELIYIKGILYLFSTRYQKDDATLFVNKISPDGTIDSESKKISEGGVISVKLSHDKNNIMIFHSYKTKKEIKFICEVVDVNLNSVWKKEFAPPYTSKQYNISDNMFFNNDYFYITLFEVEKTNEEEKTKTKSDILLCYNSKTGELKENALNFGNAHLLNIKYGIDEANNLVCCGEYSTNNKWHFFSGGFCYIFSPSTEKIIFNQTIDLDKEFPEMRSFYKWPQLMLLETGDVVLLSEKFRIYNPTSSQALDTDHLFEDLYILYFSQKGKYWVKRILKSQSRNFHYNSFISLAAKGDICLIMQNEKGDPNLNISESQNDFKFPDPKLKNAETVALIFNSEGKNKIEKVFRESGESEHLIKCNKNNFPIKNDKSYFISKTPNGEKTGILYFK